MVFPGNFASLMRRKSFSLILTLWLCIPGFLSAQTTKVSGRVYDPLTGEPISFATVQFTGTTVGKNADIDGRYSIQTDLPVDSLRANFIGYLPVTMKVKRGQTQTMDFALRANKSKRRLAQRFIDSH